VQSAGDRQKSGRDPKRPATPFKCDLAMFRVAAQLGHLSRSRRRIKIATLSKSLLRNTIERYVQREMLEVEYFPMHIPTMPRRFRGSMSQRLAASQIKPAKGQPQIGQLD